MQYAELSALSVRHRIMFRPPYADETNDPETNVMRTLLVDAPPEMVWKALTEPDLTKLYMGAILKVVLQLGKAIQWFRREEQGSHTLVAKGVVMAAQPGERLRYTTYSLNSKLPDEPASHTTVDLHLIEEDGGRTRVELWQGDLAGLPLATRRTRELGKQWVEQLVGLKRVSEELAQAKAA